MKMSVSFIGPWGVSSVLLRRSLLLILPLALAGCGLLFTDWYEPPTEGEQYSIVLASDQGRTRVVGVNRKVTSAHLFGSGVPDDLVPALKALGFGSREIRYAVQLSVGTNRIEIEACEPTITFLGVMSGAGADACGRAVIRIDAQDQEIYQVRSKVSKRHDYADIWVDSITHKQTIVGPIRVAGLETY